MRFATFVMSCAERRATLDATLAGLSACGWPPVDEVILDDGIGPRPIDRIHRTWRRMVNRASLAQSEFVLLLEDDLVFGRWFTENLSSWGLLESVGPGMAFYAALYNAGRPYLMRRPAERCLVADARFVWGSQALVMTPRTARYLDENWDSAEGNPDQRMPLIAARVTPIYYHMPSLVDHARVPTTWGGMEHVATDFDAEWRAAAPTRVDQPPSTASAALR
jgi:hypothetical protein